VSSQQKPSTNSSALAVSRAASVHAAGDSVWLAHLGFMERTTSAEPPLGSQKDVVLWEPALSLKELASELGVSCQTLYDLRSQGRGPRGFRVGRNLRFRRSEIRAWLERMEDEDDQRHHGGGH